MTNIIRILLVDDHFMMRLGLASLVAKEADMQVVAEAGTGEEAIEQCKRFSPDIILMDIRMPGMSGIAATAAIQLQQPSTKVIVLTTYEGDEDVYQALRAGAKAYLLKSVNGSELLKSIRSVHAGQYFLPAEVASKLARRTALPDLTAREKEIIARIADGRSNKEIAALLDISENTVKNHVRQVLEKLGVQDRTHGRPVMSS